MAGYKPAEIIMNFGRTQLAILRTVTPPGQAFRCSTSSQYTAALKLNAKGLLDRDPKNSWRFIGNEKGYRAICDHDDELERRIKEKRRSEMV